jgi:hypothetical protein
MCNSVRKISRFQPKLEVDHSSTRATVCLPLIVTGGILGWILSIVWGIFNICNVSEDRFSSVVRYKVERMLFSWTSYREYLFLVGPVKVPRLPPPPLRQHM